MFGAIAGAMIGGMMNQQSQARTNRANRQLAREANQFSAQEAHKNRQYQTQMSNTAHQRQVQDMKKAGLNPMLSATQGGSSTPSGAQGSAHMAQMESDRMGDALQQGVSTALDTKRLKKEIKAVDSQVDLNKAAKLTQFTQQQLNNSAATKANAEKNRVTLENDILNAQRPAIYDEAIARSHEAEERIKRSRYNQRKLKIDSKLLKTDAILNRAGTATGVINNAASLGRFKKGK